MPSCFFSSRRRHTRLQGDWSSDVCSSDLLHWSTMASTAVSAAGTLSCSGCCVTRARGTSHVAAGSRSGERRVGEEGRSRWAAYHLKKKKDKSAGRVTNIKKPEAIVIRYDH